MKISNLLLGVICLVHAVEDCVSDGGRKRVVEGWPQISQSTICFLEIKVNLVLPIILSCICFPEMLLNTFKLANFTIHFTDSNYQNFIASLFSAV